MAFQGYKQGVVCRERKDVVLDELTKLEENLGLKNKLKAYQFFSNFISWFNKRIRSIPLNLMTCSGLTLVAWND